MLKMSVGETPTADAAFWIDKFGNLEINIFTSFMATFRVFSPDLCFFCVVNATDLVFSNTKTILRIVLIGAVSFLYLDQNFEIHSTFYQKYAFLNIVFHFL